MISIEAIYIKLLNKFTSEEQNELGEFGYSTKSKYRVTKIETEERTMIDIVLDELEGTFYKKYITSDDDFERYSKIAPMGYSLAAYIEVLN